MLCCFSCAAIMAHSSVVYEAISGTNNMSRYENGGWSFPVSTIVQPSCFDLLPLWYSITSFTTSMISKDMATDTPARYTMRIQSMLHWLMVTYLSIMALYLLSPAIHCHKGSNI